MSESLESQVNRLADFIMDNIPGEPSESEGAVDTAIRILAKHYPAPEVTADRLADAVREAAENPGHTVHVEDDPWEGFKLDSDEVQR